MAMKFDVFQKYPALDEAKVDALLAQEIKNNDTKLVVLDDDPTGVQTVHDLTVYTNWEPQTLRKAFGEENKLFFIMTNSRGMTAGETTRVHRQIARNVADVAKEAGKQYLYISRSDSTLRGHYPLEPQLLREELEANEGCRVDGEILCPFFKEGGRFTIDNVHYVRYGEDLVPAAETEFARDKTFGYTKSAIPEYVEEKTFGQYKAQDVVCIGLDTIRAMELDAIEAQLMQVSDFNKICINAIDYVDIKVAAIAIYRALAKGKTFIFRTAAGLVKVLGGVSDRPLLTRGEMITKPTQHGGLVVVGSHTRKTTDQLTMLLTLENTVPIHLHAERLLEGDEAFEQEIQRCVAQEVEAISQGKTAVCFTTRTLLNLENDTKESALKRSLKISEGVQNLVSRLEVEPAFIIAKGGITSSDIGTKALGVESANVMGQISPGIPVWQTDETSKFPSIPYIIFPGNVGEASTLLEVVKTLTEA